MQIQFEVASSTGPTVHVRFPLQLPFRVQLVLPERSVTTDGSTIFNLPLAMHRLLGYSDWEDIAKILDLHIRAPGWNSLQLSEQFRTEPTAWVGERVVPDFIRDIPLDTRPESWPILGTYSPAPAYDIEHYTGVVPDGAGSYPFDVLGLPAQVGIGFRIPFLVGTQLSIRAPWRTRPSTDLRTRLIILQVSDSQRAIAQRICEARHRAGGPSILVVASRDALWTQQYLEEVYAGIVHDRPLSEIARPRPGNGEGWVKLWMGPGEEDALSLKGWTNSLRVRARGMSDEYLKVREAARRGTLTLPILHKYRPLLHRSEHPALERSLGSIEYSGVEEIGSIADSAKNLLQQLDFSHESGGVKPLVHMTGLLEQFEAQLQALTAETGLKQERIAREAAGRAPRVLNANFAEQDEDRVISENEGLVAGRRYRLLVDVGPRWTKIPSIVAGHAEFPEESLEPADQGFPVKVVFVSEKLTGGPLIGWIWVPRHSGRSTPYPELGSQERYEPNLPPGGKPGPLALEFMVPSISGGDPEADAVIRGRLCLYYAGNLIQSADVQVGVVTEGHATELKQPNRIAVDYVLSNSYQDIEETYGRRALRYSSEKEFQARDVTLNITLNDVGVDGHRLIVTGAGGGANIPVAWKHYNQAQADVVLKPARAELFNCFFMRDKKGGKTGTLRRRLDRARSHQQLLLDLQRLSEVGAGLFHNMLGLLTAEGGMPTIEWGRRFMANTPKSTVIQIARTSFIENAYPWALIYDIPLTNTKSVRNCTILEDWRQRPVGATITMADACPYSAEPWHKEDTLCPYGFWGLKHIIEEPLSRLRSGGSGSGVDHLPSLFGRQSALAVALAVTRDTRLDRKAIETHIADLMGNPKLNLTPPKGADDTQTALLAMAGADCVYLLCHGEVDTSKGVPRAFLGIGPCDGDSFHRIYPNNIDTWAMLTTPPNIMGWSGSPPLVFINGCHTLDLDPSQLMSFASSFNLAGAAGVIGTEISVQLPMAIKVAKLLFDRIGAGVPMGTAIREMRWALLDEGSLLGLAYTLYAKSDLRFARH